MLRNPESERVQAFFDGYAGAFDSIYDEQSHRGILGRLANKLFRKSMIIRFQKTLHHINQPDIRSVLDIGCGPGRYAREFLRLKKQVVGIDISANMLEMAKQLCNKESPSENFTFINSDYLNFQLERPCDASVLIGFFDYIEDPAVIFKKLVRDTTQIILASFPKGKGVLAFQRRLRYRLRRCPLYLYSRSDIVNVLHSLKLTNYEIDETDREYYLIVRLEGKRG